MEKLTKDISDIVITEVNNISEKVRGLNFLELLKNNIIEQLLSMLNLQKFPLKQLINYENEIKENSRNIKILINYYLDSLSVRKKKY